MRRVVTAATLVLLAACSSDHTATAPGGGSSTVPAFANDSLSGGDMTVFDASSSAFADPGPPIAGAELTARQIGDRIFDATFVPAPASINAGLGPRFENVSCTGCHTNDGRGLPPAHGNQFPSILFRVSLPGLGPHGGPVPVPGYGTQLETQADVGFTPEATVTAAYTDSTVSFADGTKITLHVPSYTIGAPYLAMPAGVLISPRVAPANFGLGLLEAVSDSAIQALAQAPSALSAGVAGMANYVWDSIGGTMRTGRFGLKSNQVTIANQVGAAFNGDMGVTSPDFPNEPCYDAVPACMAHAPDITDSVMQAVVTYIRTLGVPARRNIHAGSVQHGAAIFQSAGCTGCHLPTLTTGIVANEPELSNQTIHPYTDLLVHDMGAGLADNRPDFGADGSAWRTRPLWGIGLTPLINGNVNFLHDGRAQSLMEAVMWHDGQAAPAKQYVQKLSATDRNALLDFLNSL
jgi:CxxC motif-containing protein (DUF1111 family)